MECSRTEENESAVCTGAEIPDAVKGEETEPHETSERCGQWIENILKASFVLKRKKRHVQKQSRIRTASALFTAPTEARRE